MAGIAVDALQGNLDATTTIIAPDSGITIHTLAKAIADAMDYAGPIVFDPSQPEGVRAKRLESRTFSSRFPQRRFTSLRNGLDQTVRWFIKQSLSGDGVPREPLPLCHQP